MEFAVVWETYQSDVEMDIDIVFGEGDDVFLFMETAAENVQDSDNPDKRVFMNSFRVASDIEPETPGDPIELEARIEYTFSGGIDYEYVIQFLYGEPGGDNVVMVNNPLEPDEETSSAAFKRRKTQ